MTINHLKSILAFAFIGSFLLNDSIYAQDDKQDEDIYEMSLEDVMNLSLNKASVIGIPHPHTKGEWMAHYQYMPMKMKGIFDGTEEITVQEVLDREVMNQSEFMMAPTLMPMNMHMFMVMYAPTDHLTIMAMSMYKQMNMEMISKSMKGIPGDTMKMESAGISDIVLMGNIAIINRDISSILVNVGFTIPTGSINETGKNMMGKDERLAYPMQLGSGTIDPVLDLVYLRSTMKTSFGIALRNNFRLYNNKNGYRLGNHHEIITGFGYNWTKWLASTARIDFHRWNNIKGKDDELDPMLSPMARADLRAITRLDGSVGIVIEMPKGTFKGVALIFDYRTPIYQKLDGPQMGFTPHWMITLQWTHGEKTLD